MKALNASQKILLADNVVLADTAFSRMQGLLGRSSLAEGEGLLITHCNSIHMFFMKFPIDVVFLDKNNRIVGLVSNIPPFALSPIFWKADKALELPAGKILQTKSSISDQIII
ncbi:MAG: DUF192 domain-containing protein [Candidatus Omnitrophica bacterium]|nr:DUF192 domain-containing protein [Candidatus Omnitrophota bacterium]